MSEVTTAPKGDLFVHPDPIQTLLSPEKFEAFLAEIKKETGALVPDTSTQKGRDEIKRVAFKVTKTKTFLDDLGKKLNEKRREEINKVDKARRDMRDALDELKDEVRKPLTEWEEAEAARAQEIEETMAYFRGICPEVMANKGTAEALKRAIEEVEQETIDSAVFGEELVFAENARTVALADLRRALAAAEKADADRAELERLRSEAEARRQADEEKARQEAARIAEERRKEAEAAEVHRREQEAVRAAHEAAKREAEAEARAKEEAHQAELQKERLARETLEAAERVRVEQQRRLEQDAEKRRQDADHRLRVRTEAANKISELGAIGIPKADKIVMAIIAGEIPNVRLEW